MLYIFGDASGLGFGSLCTEVVSIGYQFEVWNGEIYGKIYNYREFHNLVDTLEELGRKGNLQGKDDFFLCMDNIVSEIIAVLGSSKSEVLFYLAVRMYCQSMCFKFNVHFIHVTRTCMMIQDNVIRDYLYESQCVNK